MKRSLLALLVVVASGCSEKPQPILPVAAPKPAQAPGDGAKYARCAGSTEMEKCRALVDAVAAETPEDRRARAEKLDKERLAAAQIVVKNPITYQAGLQRAVRVEPTIGMTEYEATSSTWGQPESRNRTETRHGTREQWVYGGGQYLYLENGRVTAISSRR